MNLLVFGKTGQVATELARLAPEATFLGRQEADLSDPDACAAALRDQRPTAVINAAAYTAVDQAEDEEALATMINGRAPGAMAQAAATLEIPFVHISTDYVFGGGGDSPFEASGTTAPLGVYGRSKDAGEKAVRAAGGTHAILRTSWVFSAHGSNFVKTMLRLAGSRDHLTIVSDQTGGPTDARAIADACLTIAKVLMSDQKAGGTYHFSGAPDTNWADFARAIFELSGRSVAVENIPSTAFPTKAKRPLNSRLDCSTTTKTFGLERPDWKVGLAGVLAELGESR
ncbi:MAG: dTDP-4-dehydrorhamnose reductase [Pseudomonadota bacterium]